MVKHQSYYVGERPELKPLLPERCGRVLEIGCGDGSFRNLLPGCAEYWGVEPEQTAAQQAKTRLDRVLCGLFDEVCMQLPEQYFDLVICNDVIEHIADHETFVARIKEKLSPDGCLVGSVPNVRYYKNLLSLVVTRDWQYIPKGILDNTHLRFFTEKSLNRLFVQNGLVCEELRGINSTVYLKRQYCTSLPKTIANVLKYVVRLIGFFVLDLLTLGHSIDIKYPQLAFRVRPRTALNH